MSVGAGVMHENEVIQMRYIDGAIEGSYFYDTFKATGVQRTSPGADGKSETNTGKEMR